MSSYSIHTGVLIYPAKNVAAEDKIKTDTPWNQLKSCVKRKINIKIHCKWKKITGNASDI